MILYIYWIYFMLGLSIIAITGGLIELWRDPKRNDTIDK
jgi:hypothetical protein